MSANTLKKEYAFFWSNKSPFSNWYPCRIDMDEVTFNCAEQAMMYHKALLFEDDEAADRIMKAETPRDQKALGRSVKNFDQSIWEKHRERIVYDILFAKFSQNADLQKALLDTGDAKLVEASSMDRIWGIGLAEDDPRAHDESKWLGMNLLGKLLTRLKETLYY